MNKLAGLICLCLVSAFALASESGEKIIFDTDSAYFMDDGAALATVLSSPKIEVLGVTMVAGNYYVQDGAEYMFTVLKAAHRSDIPVYLGAKQPLKNSKKRIQEFIKTWGGVAWIGAFRDVKAKEPLGGLTGLKVQPQSAVDFLIKTIRANPGQITVLALGPLTNLALAFKKAPDLAAQIKRIVIMGGNSIFTAGPDGCRGQKQTPCGLTIGNASSLAEFNFWFDPEAAKKVLRSEIPIKQIFGLDITNRAFLTKQHFDEIVSIKTPITALFESQLKGKFESGNVRNIWDTLPAAYLLDPSFVKDQEEMYVDVVDQFGPAYGMLFGYRLNSGTPGAGIKKATVMKDLDFERFFTVFKSALTKPVPD